MGQSQLDATYNVLSQAKPRAFKSKKITTRGVVKGDMKPRVYRLMTTLDVVTRSDEGMASS